MSESKLTDDLNKEFKYQCTKCGQFNMFKLREPTWICKQFLVVDGVPTTQRCHGTQVVKPKKPGWRYRVAR